LFFFCKTTSHEHCRLLDNLLVIYVDHIKNNFKLLSLQPWYKKPTVTGNVYFTETFESEADFNRRSLSLVLLLTVE